MFSLMKSTLSTLSGRVPALWLGRAMPARENSLSTSVEVGGGVRNLGQNRYNSVFFKLRFSVRYLGQNISFWNLSRNFFPACHLAHLLAVVNSALLMVLLPAACSYFFQKLEQLNYSQSGL